MVLQLSLMRGFLNRHTLKLRLMSNIESHSNKHQPLTHADIGFHPKTNEWKKKIKFILLVLTSGSLIKGPWSPQTQARWSPTQLHLIKLQANRIQRNQRLDLKRTAGNGEHIMTAAELKMYSSLYPDGQIISSSSRSSTLPLRQWGGGNIFAAWPTSYICVCSSLADCKNNTAAEEQKQLAWLVMETLTVLLQSSNNTNAGKNKTPIGLAGNRDLI